jgi:ribonucleoside-diphosphate reductase alpha chain
MTEVQEAVLKARFYHPHEKDWYDVCERVARTWGDTPEHVAAVYEMMRDRKGLPNTPAIANAGKKIQMGSACFVLPINDSLTDGPASIMGTLMDASAVHKSGGGTGFSFGRIRGRGTPVASTGRPAPGAVNVLELYSDAIARVTQAGMRPGANMGILPVDHPDIMEFIQCKNQEGRITNFNISVALTDEFMRQVTEPFPTPETAEVWTEIIEGAWRNGEPGAFFIDTANAKRLHPELFEATNPCGEVPLRPYEACVLGSVNLAAFVNDKGEFDWVSLQQTVRTMVRLLDNIIDFQDYPLPQIEQEQKRYRKIGVGVMGYADMLIKLGLVYGSDEALSWTRYLASYIQDITYNESNRIGEEKGVYPGWDVGMPIRRNLNCQVIAPTGTISRLAGCSFGIEPPYAAEYDSFIVGGQFHERYPYADSPYFRTTGEIAPERHVLTQAAWQEFVDQAVSKTVNLPSATTHKQVEDIYVFAWESGCKGITVLREGSRDDVVIENTDCKDGVCTF